MKSVFILTQSLTRRLVTQAIEWLEKHQDTPIDEIKASLAAKPDDDDEEEIKANIAALESGDEAKSLVCNDCGKRFKNEALAAYHATKRQVKSLRSRSIRNGG